MIYAFIYFIYINIIHCFFHQVFICWLLVSEHVTQSCLLHTLLELGKIKFYWIQLRWVDGRKYIFDPLLIHKFPGVITSMNSKIVHIKNPRSTFHLLLKLHKELPELLLVDASIMEFVIDQSEILTYRTDETFCLNFHLKLVDFKIMFPCTPFLLLPSLLSKHCFI